MPLALGGVAARPWGGRLAALRSAHGVSRSFTLRRALTGPCAGGDKSLSGPKKIKKKRICIQKRFFSAYF